MKDTDEKGSYKKDKKEESLTGECEWCNSTGDIEKTRRLYWSTVALIFIFIALLYFLAYLYFR